MVFDVAVVGLGAMGSAAAATLARRGLRVLGLDRFAPPHDRGSSHGKTRIIREAYFEAPFYVPLLRRAYELWDQLERDAGRSDLIRKTGGLAIGALSSELVQGALAAALEHEVPHEFLDAAGLRRRFPAFAMPEEFVAVHELRAGYLHPERCIAAQLEIAARSGAELRTDESVERWEAEPDAVTLHTARGRYEAGRVIFAAGAWMRELLADLRLPLTVTRQTLFWFSPARDAELFAPARTPIALVEIAPDRIFYTFPDDGAGVKIAVHQDGEPTAPDAARRSVDECEVAEARRLLERYLPAAAGNLRETAVCLYTNTPDQHFVIDRHPEHANVIVASPCSGHGFKFASVVGEILADLATDGASRFDLVPFAVERFARAQPRNADSDSLSTAG